MSWIKSTLYFLARGILHFRQCLPRGYGYDTILMQEGRVIDYESKKFINAELNYPVDEKEFLAIIHALKVRRHNLLGSEFKI